MHSLLMNDEDEEAEEEEEEEDFVWLDDIICIIFNGTPFCWLLMKRDGRGGGKNLARMSELVPFIVPSRLQIERAMREGEEGGIRDSERI